MNKVKFLSILVVVLLLSNLFLLFFMNIEHQRPMPREIIIERLHLDAQQIEAYDKLIPIHQQQIRQAEAKMMSLKQQLYASLKGVDSKLTTDSFIVAIAQVQQEMEHIHYAHFKDIKQLCKPEQLTSFDSLADELAKLFSPPPMKRKH